MIVLQDLDFFWTDKQVEKVKQLWEEGKHIADITKGFKNTKTQVEVFLLLLDLSLKDEIKKRKMGILGA